MRVLKLFEDLFISCLEVLVRLGTKEKLLVRTENSSSVNVWLERLCIMFFLYWEVYILMDMVINFPNEDLCWFCEKRTFIDVGVYMCFNGGCRIEGYFFCFSFEENIYRIF